MRLSLTDFAPRADLRLGVAGPLRRLRSFLPTGRALPRATWDSRHRGLVLLLWFHAIFVLGFALMRGNTLAHSVLEATAVVIPGLFATSRRLSPRLRAVMTTFGLLTASAVLVHLSGGYIELHFHFFVMVGLISLYQDWAPFLLAIGYVIFHHGVIGVLMPHQVYNHPDAQAHPWRWAMIHGGFVLASSVVAMVNWRLNELARLRAEDALSQTVAAREAVKLRDQFLSVVSHELKTPLTSLLANAQLLQRRAAREGSLNERNERTLRVVLEQTERVNRMIETLLDVSRLDQDRLRLECAPVDLRALVERCIEAIEPTVVHHRFEVNLPDAPFVVQGDAFRLEQVLLNLVQNAVKYSPDGGVARVDLCERDGSACFEVVDQGIGIPASELPSLFTRFFRASNVSTTQINGMGIGLYVVKEIVSLHGGSVEAESSEGAGSTFRVCLPLAKT